MYAYIKGEITKIAKNYLILETNSIGYIIYMSETDLMKYKVKDQATIYTYQHVKEDEISLYGFVKNEDKEIFEKIITVSGIGVKSGIAILSNISSSDFVLAVITSDVARLKKLPGIGDKSAKRIILELKDKLKTEMAIEDTEKLEEIKKDSEVKEELVEALKMLGYTTKEISKVLPKIKNSLNIEEAIKEALKQLS